MSNSKSEEILVYCPVLFPKNPLQLIILKHGDMVYDEVLGITSDIVTKYFAISEKLMSTSIISNIISMKPDYKTRGADVWYLSDFDYYSVMKLICEDLSEQLDVVRKIEHFKRPNITFTT